MMSIKNKITYITFAVVATFVMILMAFFSPLSARIVRADEEEDLVTQYEETNVWDNLQSSKIAGNKFDPKDYPHAEKDKPRILAFVEFAYALYDSNQEDYGLYIYLYNPQDLVIDRDTARNTIQLRCGKGNYEKYSLLFLNYSKEAGYEGRFWKFKINLTETQKRTILKDLEQSERVYEVSGITLCVKKEATEYTCGQKYTYSGYAKGYGSELAENDTLKCQVDGFDKYLELEVNQTCYRPQGDYYEGKQSQMNSCYFRVPEKYFTDYGELTKILCEWWEYVTQPILVTEWDNLYQYLNALHGNDIVNMESLYFLIYPHGITDSSWVWESTKGPIISNYKNIKPNYKYEFKNGVGRLSMQTYSDPNAFQNFAAVFYAGSGKKYSDRYITSDELTATLLYNSEKLGGPYVTERYSEKLFTDLVNEGHTREYNKKLIQKDDVKDVFWNITTKTFWQTVFGGYNVETQHNYANAIYEVKAEDLTGSNDEISARLFVNPDDVYSIKEEFKKCKEERLVLLRYGQSDYYALHAAQASCARNVDNPDNVLIESVLHAWDDGELTAYIAQETVYLDFDIISLWFTADGVETEIPVVMSPQDVISGLDPPLDENFHNENSKRLATAILILIILIIVFLILLLTGLLPTVLKGIWKIITLPFRLIKALIRKMTGREKDKRTERTESNSGKPSQKSSSESPPCIGFIKFEAGAPEPLPGQKKKAKKKVALPSGKTTKKKKKKFR